MNQKPKGTKDIYGYRSNLRQLVLKTLDEVSNIFNYKKLETPIFERSQVFIKSVGETSDIVSKEMYSFEDKGGRSMTLRPEGTAGAIRAIVENKLYAQLPLKVYYQGPMFRYENPQKGRQRQFTQYGVEVLGEKSPLLDAEVILTASTILDSLEIPFTLEINSLGNKKIRDKWSLALREYFIKHKEGLTSDSVQRIETNPMRILDDKVDGKKDFVKNAPKISEFYDEETRTYFDELKNFLKTMEINFVVNDNLVRGLDYYTDTTFEFISVSEDAGSQSTIIGGGRYENLVKNSGGPDISGIGFGLGIERLVNDLEAKMSESDVAINPEVFVMNIAKESSAAALGIVYLLRRVGIATAWNYKPTKIQKAFDKADKSGAAIKIIAGPKDLEENNVVVKYDKNQESVAITDLPDYITNILGGLDENN